MYLKTGQVVKPFLNAKHFARIMYFMYHYAIKKKI